jgi:diacylglycerol kinase (ATP)
LRIALVYNPASSEARLARIAELANVLEARGHWLSRHDSGNFDCARDARGADLICICGGDGTAGMVVEAQADRLALPPLAIFPCGTINLLARELGYPRDAVGFARRIGNGAKPRSSPLAFAGERPFLACASIGVDALAVAGLSVTLKARIGRLAYVLALARQLWSWPRPQLSITADGERISAEALFLMRGSFYAGPWTLDPRAGLFSDRLHLLCLPRARRRDIALLAIYALSGARRLPRGWRLKAANDVTVAAEAGIPVQADGDIIGAAPLRFRLTGDCLQWA